MKRIVLLFVGLLFIGFSISSCKECTSCYFEYPGETNTTPEEFCGSKSEVNDFEKRYEEEAALLPGIGITAVCKRN